MRKRKLIHCILLMIFILLLSGCSKNSKSSGNESQNDISITPIIEEPSVGPTVTPIEITVVPTVIPTMPPEEESESMRVAKNLMHTMTLEEKVAQMFFVRCPEEHAEEILKEYQFGGYLLFARDFEGETKESVTKKITK